MSGQITAERHSLGCNTSVLLDVVRFFAAAIVATTHLSIFVRSKPLLPGASANAAVCIFFVLSGFVIRFVTVTRETDAAEYWIDRASRIYSVVAPTLALTVLFEGAAFLCNPAIYHGFAQPYVWTQVPGQLFTNMTFTSGYWGYGSAPLSNLPFWSLTYECVYYVLYGLMHYTRKLRWFMVPLILLIVGPSIGLLFIVWWMGVLLFEAYSRLSRSRKGPMVAAVIAFSGVSLFFLFSRQIIGFLHRTDVDWRRAQATRLAASTSIGHRLFHGAPVPWIDRLSISFFFTGILFCLVVLALTLALDSFFPVIPRSAARAVRTVADSTFTLYLLHVPFFILAFTIAGGPSRTWLGGTIAFVAAVLLSIAFAIQFDRLKLWMRNRLHQFFVPSVN